MLTYSSVDSLGMFLFALAEFKPCELWICSDVVRSLYV